MAIQEKFADDAGCSGNSDNDGQAKETAGDVESALNRERGRRLAATPPACAECIGPSAMTAPR
jgi:hypothetical protein